MARLTGGQRALKAFVLEKENRSQFTVESIITSNELLTKGTIRAKASSCRVVIDPITGEKKKICEEIYAKVAKKRQ